MRVEMGGEGGVWRRRRGRRVDGGRQKVKMTLTGDISALSHDEDDHGWCVIQVAVKQPRSNRVWGCLSYVVTPQVGVS